MKIEPQMLCVVRVPPLMRHMKYHCRVCPPDMTRAQTCAEIDGEIVRTRYPDSCRGSDIRAPGWVIDFEDAPWVGCEHSEPWLPTDWLEPLPPVNLEQYRDAAATA